MKYRTGIGIVACIIIASHAIAVQTRAENDTGQGKGKSDVTRQMETERIINSILKNVKKGRERIENIAGRMTSRIEKNKEKTERYNGIIRENAKLQDDLAELRGRQEEMEKIASDYKLDTTNQKVYAVFQESVMTVHAGLLESKILAESIVANIASISARNMPASSAGEKK